MTRLFLHDNRLAIPHCLAHGLDGMGFCCCAPPSCEPFQDVSGYDACSAATDPPTDWPIDLSGFSVVNGSCNQCTTLLGGTVVMTGNPALTCRMVWTYTTPGKCNDAFMGSYPLYAQIALVCSTSACSNKRWRLRLGQGGLSYMSYQSDEFSSSQCEYMSNIRLNRVSGTSIFGCNSLVYPAYIDTTYPT